MGVRGSTCASVLARDMHLWLPLLEIVKEKNYFEELLGNESHGNKLAFLFVYSSDKAEKLLDALEKISPDSCKKILEIYQKFPGNDVFNVAAKLMLRPHLRNRVVALILEKDIADVYDSTIRCNGKIQKLADLRDRYFGPSVGTA